MSLLKRGILVLGLAGCVLFVSPFGTHADDVNFTPSATASINEKGDEAEITIQVRGSQPNAFYTVWIRLNGANPITGLRNTPLAPTTAIDALRAVTPDPEDFDQCFAIGSTAVINGFFTDAQGNGSLSTTVNFRLSDGMYPFNKYDPTLAPVPVKREGAGGATLRIISHCFDQCCDQIGHGMVPGPHVVKFNWALPPGF